MSNYYPSIHCEDGDGDDLYLSLATIRETVDEWIAAHGAEAKFKICDESVTFRINREMTSAERAQYDLANCGHEQRAKELRRQEYLRLKKEFDPNPPASSL